MGFKVSREVPLKVVVVDGIRWLKHPKSGYYSASEWQYRKEGRHPQLHVYIWERENGKKVPEGWDIHHVDMDKDNNDISNLVALPRSEHMKLHASLMTKEQKELGRKYLRECAQPVARIWHKSEEGRAWHRKHAREFNFGHRKQITCICAYCGSELTGYSTSRFCSNAHKSAWRRKMRLDDIEKVCVVCGTKFMSSKYESNKTCSHACYAKIRGRPKGAKDKRKRAQRVSK